MIQLLRLLCGALIGLLRSSARREVYGYREHVVAGGVISYGVDLRWCYRRGAYFVDKILHGTPPGELHARLPPDSLCPCVYRKP
jgi:hypothetical protein